MASLRPRVAAIIADLLDAMAQLPQPVDLHEAVSFPFPTLVICELFGVPYADREDFHHWSDDAGNLIDAVRAQTGLMQLSQYMRALVDRKQADALRQDPALTEAASAERRPHLDGGAQR